MHLRLFFSELFVFDEMAGDECEYLVRFAGHYSTLEGAKSQCEAKNSVLVVIRNIEQQLIVENIIRRYYDDTHVSSLFNYKNSV